MPRGQLNPIDRLRSQVSRLSHLNSRYRQVIADLRQQLTRQAREITALQAKLEDKEAQRKELTSFLYKPNRATTEPKPLGKKPGGPAFHRAKPQPKDVTETQRFPLSQCPTCKTPLASPAETVTRYEEDIDLAPKKIVREYLIDRYWCPRCREIVRSPRVPAISAIGLNVLGYILYTRYRLRLPFNKIRESLLDLHNFRISEGEIAAQLQEAETLFGKDYQAITELIRSARVVYADETGWRMNGQGWWLWVFAASQGTRYLIELSRGKGLPAAALGLKQDRVIVSDGYAVYDKLPGDHQQCWVHLLRKARLVSLPLHTDLVKLYLGLGQELTKAVPERDPPAFEKQLASLISKRYREPGARKVQARLQKHRAEFLTCLKYEDVLPENNTAERALRPQVVMRKITGGCRSLAGARAFEVNASVIATRLQNNPGASFFSVMLPLLKQRVQERMR